MLSVSKYRPCTIHKNMNTIVSRMSKSTTMKRILPSISCRGLKWGYKCSVALPWKGWIKKKLKITALARLYFPEHNPESLKENFFFFSQTKGNFFKVILITQQIAHPYNTVRLHFSMLTQLWNKSMEHLTVRDSLLRPLVTKLNPWVSMATPVRWTCSSTYLQNGVNTYTQIIQYKTIQLHTVPVFSVLWGWGKKKKYCKIIQIKCIWLPKPPYAISVATS